MTIAVVGCDHGAPGGISRVIRLTLDSPLAVHWKLWPVATWVTGPRWRRALVFARAVSQVWARAAMGQLQAVHVHMAARGSFWRKWALCGPLPMLGVRVIVHIHDGTFPDWVATRGPFTRNRLKSFLEKADAVITLSPSWMRTLKPLAPEAAWEVIRNPVASPPAAWMKSTAIERWGAPSDGDRDPGRKVILFLGRLRAEKGLDEVLSAALAMKHHRPVDEWYLAGDGDIEAVQQRLLDTGLSTQVRLLGWLDEEEKALALAAADLLVLPSHAEGQPLAVLEAMAWGVPVVASDVGDIPDLLASGAGLVVPRGDVPALVLAVRRILENPGYAHQMGRQGRLYVQRHHSLERMACDLDRLYRRLGLSARADPVPSHSHPEV